MRRRTDAIDQLLEDWAGWRQCTASVYDSTGSSALVRFREPAGTRGQGGYPLWTGVIASQLSRLNNHLTVEMGSRLSAVLVLYGLPGSRQQKADRLKISLSTINNARNDARAIAVQYLPVSLSAADFGKRRV